MKILFVTDPQVPFSKLHTVGATMLPYSLAEHLTTCYKDISIDFLTYNDVQAFNSSFNIIDLGEPKARYQQQVYQKLLEIEQDYDLIHIHISTPGFVKYLVSFEERIQRKIIYTMHTWTDSLAVSRFYREYFDKLVNDSYVNIVFLTHIQSQVLLKNTGFEDFNHSERIHYIYNAIPEKCDSTSKKIDRVIAVGRMVESKGIGKIIKACIEANQNLLLVSPPWRMTPKEEEYRNYILGLLNDAPEGLITLVEGMPHRELLKEIGRSKVSILYSTFDVFSLFILESISQGTPVLALRSGSTAEVCDILHDAGVTGFNKYKDLVNLLKTNNYTDHVDQSKIPADCLYDNFIKNYYYLYTNIFQINNSFLNKF